MPKYPYDKSCIHCGSTFSIRMSWQKTNMFCSHACASDSRMTHPRRSQCVRCNKPLSGYQRKFCSRSCAASTNNTIAPKRTALLKPKKEKKANSIKVHRGYKCKCKHCGFVGYYEKARFYCGSHISLYSHSGRARYWFTINVYNYPDLFDLESLKRVGFRSSKNPNGYTRDHKVSVNEAVKNGYDPYYITHVMNCELMLWPENNKKKTKSSISYDELIKLVDEYDSKNGRGYRT